MQRPNDFTSDSVFARPTPSGSRDRNTRTELIVHQGVPRKISTRRFVQSFLGSATKSNQLEIRCNPHLYHWIIRRIFKSSLAKTFPRGLNGKKSGWF